MPNKIYKVIDGTLTIRKTPNGSPTGKNLGHGETVEIINDSVSEGGYVWLQHADGWSAMGKDDNSEVYMRHVVKPNEPYIYRTIIDGLSIRDNASGRRKGSLERNTEIRVDPNSRTEKGGYIWWQHAEGWSAERSTKDREILMKEVFDTSSTSTPTSTGAGSGQITGRSGQTSSSEPKTPYVVIDGPVSIRKKPDGDETGKYLAEGREIGVIGEPVTAGGYVWVQHDEGWSAFSNDNETEVYMYDLSKRDPDAPRVFRVVSGYVTIRKEAAGTRISKKLYNGMEVTVDPKSRTEKGLYIWWKHTDGWTAERSIDSSEVYLKEVFNKDTLNPVDPDAKVEIPSHWTGKFYLQVADDVTVRNKPTTDTWTLIVRTIKRGKVVECDMDTLTEADSYYWVKHDLGGWSAIQRIDGKVKFLAEPGTIPGLIAIGKDGPKAEDLPDYHALFTRLPVSIEDTEWLQYFGNIMFAMRNGASFGYNGYSQGLHGGIDFGNNSKLAPVYAGLEATYWKKEHRTQNNKIYLIKDDYVIIYQHLTKMQGFTKGQRISPDTLLGYTEHNSVQTIVDGKVKKGWDHLHLEVRFMEDWIVNPLLLFSDQLRSDILTNFNPKKENTNFRKDFPKSHLNFFYKTDTWDKWTSPYEQPMIKLAGDIIGPKAELKRSEW